MRLILRGVARTVRDAKAWRPATIALLSDGFMHRRRNALSGITDREHLEAAAQWLARAQDAQRDGGVSGRYHVGTGWSSSYPETTGYIVPTLLALETDAGLSGFRARAKRCIDFLLSVQLESGAFPGMEIADNRDRASVFNSAQILNGLTAWHRATGDETTLRAARRVADWLTAEQDADGSWRRHLYGSGRTYTYMAHAGCWLAEFGSHADEPRYLAAARRHLEWVLRHVDASTGWINDCGFEEGDQGRAAITHTIAYTIRGVLMMSAILGHEPGMDAARRAAHAVARRLELSRWLPGKLDSNWKAVSNYACLTGNAQMALIWLELHRLEGDPALVSAACKAIDLVKRAQPMRSTNPGFRGGIPGSDPIWGHYIPLAVPNWAAKFYIDALLAQSRTLGALAPLPSAARGAPRAIPSGIPRSLPSWEPSPGGARRPRIVLLADEYSPKIEQFTEAWSTWGFRADAVVVRQVPDPPRVARLRQFVREYGLRRLARRLVGLPQHIAHEAPRQGTSPTSGMSVTAYCAARGIPTVPVGSLEDMQALERVQALNADLFVYAGCGIVRAPLLALAPLGMVNAHMGLLPPIRGMNVAEWSVFIGAPVGCTVHLIDTGIDTGDIVLFQSVDISDAASIDEMRQRVDVAQIDALGRVVRWILEHNSLPPVYSQRPDEGRQYFAMHDALRTVLQKKLRSDAAAAPERSQGTAPDTVTTGLM